MVNPRIGTTEIVLLLALALVIFGGGKIQGLGKALGTSIRDFKKEVGSSDEQIVEKAAEPEVQKEEVTNA